MLERQAKILVWTGFSPSVEKLHLQAVTTEIVVECAVLVDKTARDTAWMKKGEESREEVCLCPHINREERQERTE